MAPERSRLIVARRRPDDGSPFAPRFPGRTRRGASRAEYLPCELRRFRRFLSTAGPSPPRRSSAPRKRTLREERVVSSALAERRSDVERFPGFRRMFSGRSRRGLRKRSCATIARFGGARQSLAFGANSVESGNSNATPLFRRRAGSVRCPDRTSRGRNSELETAGPGSSRHPWNPAARSPGATTSRGSTRLESSDSR